MKSSLSVLFVILSAQVFSAQVFGQSANLDARPGLWETTTVTHSSGMPPIDTSKMPAEARQKLEETMKKRQTTPETRTTRSCMTKERLEKDMFMSPQQASCKRTIVTNTKSTIEVKVECANEKYPMVGTFRIDAVSRESVKGNFKANVGPMVMDTALTAKWISDSCGDVK
jgi:hypothetical protein